MCIVLPVHRDAALLNAVNPSVMRGFTSLTDYAVVNYSVIFPTPEGGQEVCAIVIFRQGGLDIIGAPARLVFFTQIYQPTARYPLPS